MTFSRDVTSYVSVQGDERRKVREQQLPASNEQQAASELAATATIEPQPAQMYCNNSTPNHQPGAKFLKEHRISNKYSILLLLILVFSILNLNEFNHTFSKLR